MKEKYLPFPIGNSFRICPPDVLCQKDDRHNLIMARGAFGSGEHETTRSCLEILESLPGLAGAKSLDLGSGTGILTIASLTLGGAEAWCVDIQPEAVESAREHCQLNQVEKNVEHLCGTLEQLNESGFDLVLANIYGDILLDVAENLVSKAKPGAWMLLSGILWEYNFDVRRRYQQLGCRVLKNMMLEEFSTVLLQKEQ